MQNERLFGAPRRSEAEGGSMLERLRALAATSGDVLQPAADESSEAQRTHTCSSKALDRLTCDILDLIATTRMKSPDREVAAMGRALCKVGNLTLLELGRRMLYQYAAFAFSWPGERGRPFRVEMGHGLLQYPHLGRYVKDLMIVPEGNIPRKYGSDASATVAKVVCAAQPVRVISFLPNFFNFGVQASHVCIFANACTDRTYAGYGHVRPIRQPAYCEAPDDGRRRRLRAHDATAKVSQG